MNSLHLSGYGVKIKVRNLKSRSELEVTNGREDKRPYTTTSYRPRRFPHSSVIIDGHSGYISLQALHWLSRNKVPVFVLNYDGNMISSILPPMPIKADLRAAQIAASSSAEKKFCIAKALVQTKIARSLQVLDWLSGGYDLGTEVLLAKREATRFGHVSCVADIRTVEGRVALRYWETLRKAIPESFDFHGRMTSTHQNNASDPVNLALNYAYGVLEGECRRAINTIGLEPSVGFLHTFSNFQTKQSLVYDLMEPFRWLADISVMQAIESKALDLSDFYFTSDDYRYHLSVEAKQRFIAVIRERFNAGARYKGQTLKWDTVIERKTAELGLYLAGRASLLEFAEPLPILETVIDYTMRTKIIGLTSTHAKELGIRRSTLHHLRSNARTRNSFKIYEPVKKKLRRLN